MQFGTQQLVRHKNDTMGVRLLFIHSEGEGGRALDVQLFDNRDPNTGQKSANPLPIRAKTNRARPSGYLNQTR